ncbi:Epsin-3, clathrin recruitment and traffic between the Golgi and endosome [Chytridiales sp. JEL 0842]|nr:Epsin-3, clathrin recruitment and traffic between the Golgi and endosome [Chytridiales sp. JEL 0842]
MDFSSYFDVNKLSETFNKVKNAVLQLSEYQALQLLEYLIKNGSERVIDHARDHVYELKALKNFNFIDDKGKDQGINVRQRAKEIADLLNDTEKIKEERQKARENKAKYKGVSSTEARYGGFGGSSYSGSSGGGGSSSSYSNNSGGFRDDRGYDAPSRSTATVERRDTHEKKPAEVDYAPKSKIVIKLAGTSSSTEQAKPVQQQEANLLDMGGDGDDWGDFTSAPATSATQSLSSPTSQNVNSTTGTPSAGAQNTIFGDFADFQSAPLPSPTHHAPPMISSMTMSSGITPMPMSMHPMGLPPAINTMPIQQPMGMMSNVPLMPVRSASSPVKPPSNNNNNNFDLLGGFGGLSVSGGSASPQEKSGTEKKMDAFANLVSLDPNALSGMGKKEERAGPSLNALGSNFTSFGGSGSMAPMGGMQGFQKPMATGQTAPLRPTTVQNFNQNSLV